MIRLLLPALVACLALPASAQTIEATTLDLTNDGTFDPDVDCAFAHDRTLAWFDGGTQSFYVYNDEDATVDAVQERISAADVDTAAGVDADRCRAAAYDSDSDTAFFALSAADNVDFIVSVSEDANGDLVVARLTSPTTGAADGVTGLAVSGDKLYIAIQDFVNEPPAGGAAALEDGVYSIAFTGGDQTPAEVATLSDLSLSALSATSDGTTLYAASNRFGSGDYQNVLVSIDLVGDPAGISIFADPFDGNSFTVPTDENRFDLDALTVASDGTNEAVFVLNNNFSGADGEEIARFIPDPDASTTTMSSLFASQASILMDLGRTDGGFTPGGGPTTLLYDEQEDVLFILNSSAFGGTDEVLVVASDDFATDAEDGPVLASFTAGPNPFERALGVTLTVEQSQIVSVGVYDVLGRQVAALHDGPLVAGERLSLQLDGTDLTPGTYLVRVRTEAGTLSRAVTLAR